MRNLKVWNFTTIHQTAHHFRMQRTMTMTMRFRKMVTMKTKTTFGVFIVLDIFFWNLSMVQEEDEDAILAAEADEEEALQALPNLSGRSIQNLDKWDGADHAVIRWAPVELPVLERFECGRDQCLNRHANVCISSIFVVIRIISSFEAAILCRQRVQLHLHQSKCPSVDPSLRFRAILHLGKRSQWCFISIVMFYFVFSDLPMIKRTHGLQCFRPQAISLRNILARLPEQMGQSPMFPTLNRSSASHDRNHGRTRHLPDHRGDHFILDSFSFINLLFTSVRLSKRVFWFDIMPFYHA